MMRVEQPQLLAAMHGVERLVDVEHDAAGHLAEAVAVMLDHGSPHAQQSTRIRQVLQARDGRLRAKVAIIRQPSHRQLEHRVTAQGIGVVAVLVARRNHQHARADDLVQAMDHPAGITRVSDAARQARGDGKPLLDLAQRQQPTIGRHAGTVETRLNRLAADR